MIIDETSVKELIGEEQYFECIAFFQEMFERKCDYKIIMTRRCFSLYKIFLPILTSKGINNEYGKIITDKALPFYSEDINTILSDSKNNNISVLIMDDIIIFGRTINSLIEQIISRVEMSEDQLLDKVLVRCIWQNKYNSKIRKKFEKCVLPQAFASKMDWKRSSCKYSALIKSANIAYTSYIVSYRNEYKNIPNKDEFQSYCENNMIENRTSELKKLGVKSYILNATLSTSGFFNDFVESCSLRVYFYDKLNSVVISPLVIMRDMSSEEMDLLCSKFVEDFGVERYRYSNELLCKKNDKYYTNKMQFISVLLSHMLLCSFLKNRNIKYDSNDFDYKEILGYNFTPHLADEFVDLGEKIYGNVSCDTFSYSYENKSLLTYTSKVEKFLFRQAMLDNKSATVENSSRLEGFSEIGEERVFSSHLMPIVISLIDSGKAALRSFYEKNRFVSKMYAGEQAFRIMNDKFEEYLKHLYSLERYSALYEKNSYDLYRRFISFMHDNLLIDDVSRESLLEYIDILAEANQQISDIYVYDIHCNNPSMEKYLSDFIEKEVK